MLISTVSLLSDSRLRTEEFIANCIAFIEAVLLIITLFQDFSVKFKLGTLKIITGVILIAFGITLFTILLNVSPGGRSKIYALGFPMAIWIILLGAFDVFRVKRLSNEHV